MLAVSVSSAHHVGSVYRTSPSMTPGWRPYSVLSQCPFQNRLHCPGPTAAAKQVAPWTCGWRRRILSGSVKARFCMLVLTSTTVCYFYSRVLQSKQTSVLSLCMAQQLASETCFVLKKKAIFNCLYKWSRLLRKLSVILTFLWFLLVVVPNIWLPHINNEHVLEGSQEEVHKACFYLLTTEAQTFAFRFWWTATEVCSFQHVSS